MGRWPVTAILVGVVALTSAAPASAKMPPYSCELSTTRPVVGQPVRVEVRFWNDADHTDPARWWNPLRRFRDFVEARAIDRGEPEAFVPEVLHATVVRVAPGVYRGELLLPDTRRFRIEGCGDGYDRHGYPSRDGIVIVPRAFHGSDPGRSGARSSVNAVALGAVAIGVGVGTALLVRVGVRRRGSSVPPG